MAHPEMQRKLARSLTTANVVNFWLVKVVTVGIAIGVQLHVIVVRA